MSYLFLPRTAQGSIYLLQRKPRKNPGHTAGKGQGMPVYLSFYPDDGERRLIPCASQIQ